MNNSADFRSVNLIELENLRDTLIREMQVLDVGFESFIRTIESLKQNGFIQGQLGVTLGDVRKRLERVREQYSMCIGDVHASIEKVKQTAINTDSKHNTNLLDLAAIDPAKFTSTGQEGSTSSDGAAGASNGEGLVMDDII